MKGSIKLIRKVLDLSRKYKSPYGHHLENELCEQAVLNYNYPVNTKGVILREAYPMEVSGVACTVETLYNPYALMLKGLGIASSVTDTVSKIVILVDDTYMLLSKNAREFVKWHELGHIECRHSATATTSLDRMMKSYKGSVDRREIEADSYAASVMGRDRAYAALREMAHFYKKGLAYKELKRRATIVKGGEIDVQH